MLHWKDAHERNKQAGMSGRLDIAELADRLGARLRPGPAQSRTVTDAFVNSTTGLGVSGIDRRLGTGFRATTLDNFTAAQLWAGNDLAAKVVETWPTHMLRQGFDIVVSGDDGQDISKQIEERLRQVGAVEALRKALEYERAYGGGAVIIGANDSRGDLRKPLDLEKPVTLDWLAPFEPDELRPREWETEDMSAPRFGEPSIWTLQAYANGGIMPSPVDVHDSRLIVFGGIRTTRRVQTGVLNGWGASQLSRFHDRLVGFNVSWDSAEYLLTDIAQAVIKMKNLAQMVAAGDAAAIRARMETIAYARSVLKTMLLDTEEEYDRKPTPLQGVPDILDRMMFRLAAAADMPVTMLFGMSPGGLNATGESDIEIFNDRVKAEQVRCLTEPIMRLARLAMNDLGIEEPEEWKVVFRPLRQQTELEITTTRNMQANTDAIYLDRGVLSPLDVAKGRFGKEGYSIETSVDIDELEKELAAEAEQAEADRALMEQQMAQGNEAEGDEDQEKETPDDESPPEDEE